MAVAESFPTPDELKGAFQGTVIYLALYVLWLMPFQVWSKFHLLEEKKKEAQREGNYERVSYKAIKYYNSKDILALAGDRTVGNFVEFAVVFLPLMWMHALFVDASKSLVICCLYVFFRSYYPIVYQQGMNILFSTIPGYIIVGYLLLQVTRAAFF